MYLTWHGQGCFKIQFKDVTLVTDPLDPQSGLRLGRLSNINIITLSNSSGDSLNKFKTDALIIDGPGEYEVKQTFIKGVPITQNNSQEPLTIYWIELEGVSLVYLGKLNSQLTDEQIEIIEDVDALLVPVGGHNVLDSKRASQVINEIEPRIVIPMYYHIPGLKIKLDLLDSFCKEMGVKSTERVDRFKLQKKDLLQEETKIIVLQNQ